MKFPRRHPRRITEHQRVNVYLSPGVIDDGERSIVESWFGKSTVLLSAALHIYIEKIDSLTPVTNFFHLLTSESYPFVKENLLAKTLPARRRACVRNATKSKSDVISKLYHFLERTLITIFGFLCRQSIYYFSQQLTLSI